MNDSDKLNFSSVAAGAPAAWPEANLRMTIRQLNEARQRKIIVLDDDPTGVQTVHDIDVLTSWDKELLSEAFDKPETVFYILTNTRGLDAPTAARINREIARNVSAVATAKGKEFVFVSRSDSTLRGYYPLEIDVLSAELASLHGRQPDGHLIIPAFFEAGRVTYGNVHYIVDQDEMVPAHQTEFAKDRVFGFSHGDLTEWVAEKTEGRTPPGDCIVLTLDQIRRGPETVKDILLAVEGNRPIIVNALSYPDLDVLAYALLQAEEAGKRFIFRTAASFVKAYGGIGDRPYLLKDMLIAQGQEAHGGLVVVGSYVQKTTDQLRQLLEHSSVVPVEINVENILNPDEQEAELKRAIATVNEQLAQGSNVVVYSSRKLIARSSKQANLDISQTVSGALVQIVQSLQVTPKFIIAKGGITSSDVATKGLGIRKAKILGQVFAGIPVWMTGEEAKFAGIPYIVFPGNVGTERTLLETVQKIEGLA
ncbi:four-carbon acid sugar kinase family protein [Paenibacillus piri]|uniref:Hydroxyacid dehydrogenase n=1 Tax=Paenibacillus piri TaxID=2547395 RepID=A0A4R5KIX7_9BACL|nr:four-carbon acid sugar kinase family protein [Paenibacillus piri]TDF95443.1 hydroxyacid dehydrogenase [Paenibacillus piri]